MKRSCTVIGFSLLLSFSISSAAIAQSSNPAGFQGSYIGILVDGNSAPQKFQSFVRSGNPTLWLLDEAVGQYRIANPQTINGEATGSQFQGRLDLPNSPISLRGTVFTGDQSKAILPTLTYDVPVGRSTNVYAGAGYVFVQSPGERTPLGGQDGVVLTTGVEAAIDKRIVIYGDAKLNLNGVNSDDGKVRFQFGAGYRF